MYYIYKYIYIALCACAIYVHMSISLSRVVCIRIITQKVHCKLRYGFSMGLHGMPETAGAPRVFTKNGTPLPLSLAANIYSQAVPVQLQLEPYVSNASERYGTLLSSRVARGVFFL